MFRSIRVLFSAFKARPARFRFLPRAGNSPERDPIPSNLSCEREVAAFTRPEGSFPVPEALAPGPPGAAAPTVSDAAGIY